MPVEVARARFVESLPVDVNERVQHRSRVVVSGDAIKVHLHQLF
jgi:hypothetical protein